MANPGGAPLKYPGGRRTLWGVAAFVGGYLLSFLAVGLRFESVLQSVVVDGRYSDPMSLGTAIEGSQALVPDAWQAAGSFLYGAHFVGVSVPMPSGFPTTSTLVTGGDAPTLALVAVPPLALVAAGYAITRHVGDAHDFAFDLGKGGRSRFAWNGALVTLSGYLPAVLVGLGVFSLSNPLQPDPLAGWVLAGLVYPAVFGAAGGVLAHRLGDYEGAPEDVGGIHDRDPDPDPDRERPGRVD
jgi:hypothetical protein